MASSDSPNAPVSTPFLSLAGKASSSSQTPASNSRDGARLASGHGLVSQPVDEHHREGVAAEGYIGTADGSELGSVAPPAYELELS